MSIKLFTSESVSEGHPDKVADIISDSILDEILKQDPNARVACETFIKTGMVVLGGEITTTAVVDYEEITRQAIREIGYTHSDLGFDGNTCAVLNCIGKQSPDINQGVDRETEREQGAGDQGIMFGYACKETEDYMPAPIYYAHKIVKQQALKRKANHLDWLRPDAKSQVTFKYNDKNEPVKIDTIVLSTQHDPHVKYKEIKEGVIEEIIKPVIPDYYLIDETKFFINPTGKFVIGGPVGDCGLTGRKIIVDTYGGMARHGGGAFSGKDPSKVDRSAAYACRYIAKKIISLNFAEKIEIQISYAIGVAEPTSIYVNTFGTGTVSDYEITQYIKNNFDLTPYGIIEGLKLKRPIYKQTAAYGHFGNNQFPWEKMEEK